MIDLISGWGRTIAGDKRSDSDVLMEVKMEVVDEKTCQVAMVNDTITKDMICAVAQDKDTCKVIYICGYALN